MKGDSGQPITIEDVHEVLPNIEQYLDNWTGEKYEENHYQDLTEPQLQPHKIDPNLDEQIRIINAGGKIIVLDDQLYAIRGPTVGETLLAEAEMFIGKDGLADFKEPQSMDRWYAYQTETDKLLGIKRKRYHVTPDGKLMATQVDPTYNRTVRKRPRKKKIVEKPVERRDKMVYYSDDEIDFI